MELLLTGGRKHVRSLISRLSVGLLSGHGSQPGGLLGATPPCRLSAGLGSLNAVNPMKGFALSLTLR